MTPDQLTQQVIDWLHSRLDIDLEDLPKGQRDDCRLCPIANAVASNPRYQDVQVDGFGVEYAATDEGREYYYGISAPKFVRQWISEFDNGKYPQYEEEARP